MKARFLALLLAVLFYLVVGCKKDNYTLKPSPFNKGDQVWFKENNFRKSFIPFNCCDCPCTIDSVYKVVDERFWYYNVRDTHDTVLIHVDNEALKRHP